MPWQLPALHQHFLAGFQPVGIGEEMNKPLFDGVPNLAAAIFLAPAAEVVSQEFARFCVRQTV